MEKVGRNLKEIKEKIQNKFTLKNVIEISL
jgi:hypothetical protein